MATVLIVDDDENFASGMAEFLRLSAHKPVLVGTIAEAREALDQHEPALVVLDLMLPDGNGLELLDAAAVDAERQVVITTGHEGVSRFIGGVEGRNISYLTKPVDPKALLGILNAAEAEQDGDDAIPGAEAHFGLIIGQSPAMLRVCEKIRQVAPMDCTVFIRGESGTGKELVAEAIHRASNRSGAYVPVNCGGLSPELVSSELFGHEKGSFTGAAKRHRGFFERAHNGTLFLDEITEMPLELQTWLLRVLENDTITRVGGEQEIPVNVRLVAATNRDPVEAIEAGKLREDLYFRLQVFPIQVPALRDRGEDIRLLAECFLREFNRHYGTEHRFSDRAVQDLTGHHWPGNVRELRHAVHHACVINEAPEIARMSPDDFGAQLAARRDQPAVGQSIADMERQLILATLEHYDGDKKAAAATLGVSLKTLYNRLRDYDMG